MASKHGKGHMHIKFYIFNLLWQDVYLGTEGQPPSSGDPHALRALCAALGLTALPGRRSELAAPPPTATARRPPPTATNPEEEEEEEEGKGRGREWREEEMDGEEKVAPAG